MEKSEPDTWSDKEDKCDTGAGKSTRDLVWESFLRVLASNCIA